jgi:pimeloyl-ACP methyl ester carboxylesterase
MAAGPVDGPAVVFLHAGVADHRMWLGQVAAVAAAGYRALAYDRRGFGGAAADDVPFSHLDDLGAVLDAQGVQRAVLVGCSMGGGLAVDFALAQPARVAGLVPVAPAVSGGDFSFSGTDEAVETALAEAEASGDAEWSNRAAAAAWPRSPEGRVGGAARALFLDMNGKALAKPPLTQQRRAPEAWPRLGEIAVPALVLTGALDFNYMLALHVTLVAALPRARGTILADTAHLPSLERPDLFNPPLLEFLATMKPH